MNVVVAGATLRAAKLLMRDTLPWESADVDRSKYFNAGGNGVAMRIAPHVLAGGALRKFGQIADDVVADGVITHGHPRALVGALAYGFALWCALRTEGTLEFGQLLREVADSPSEWASPRDIGGVWSSWSAAAEGKAKGCFETLASCCPRGA